MEDLMLLLSTYAFVKILVVVITIALIIAIFQICSTLKRIENINNSILEAIYQLHGEVKSINIKTPNNQYPAQQYNNGYQNQPYNNGNNYRP